MALGKFCQTVRTSLLLSLLFSLSACASGPTPPKLPYNSWYVGLAAPRYMEVWVEGVDVIDTRGMAYFHVFGGVASYTGKVEGWHQGGGKTMPVNNVDLPDRIFLRWQSLAEPQTYKINIKIPQRVRLSVLYCSGQTRKADGKNEPGVRAATIAMPSRLAYMPHTLSICSLKPSSSGCATVRQLVSVGPPASLIRNRRALPASMLARARSY